MSVPSEKQAAKLWQTAFEPFDLSAESQRMLGAPHPPGTISPLALRPKTSEGEEGKDLDTVIDAIKRLQTEDGGLLTEKLAVHGTLLFRGLPIHSADDFSRFAHAFGYKPHEVIGNVIVRPEKAPNVAPANEGPTSMRIYSHNESAQLPHTPDYIFFYGHQVPAKGVGGETPSSSSLELFHRIHQDFPEFIDDLAAKGVLSIVTYKTEKQYAGGSTLRQAFGKEELDDDDQATRRAKAEAQIKRCARGPYTTWEWQGSRDEEGGETLVVTHRLPALRKQPGTGHPTLFTGLAAYWKNWELMLANNSALAHARGQSMRQRYGDGTIIPDRYLARLAEISDELRVMHSWERGDVLLFDNLAAQHGRQPWNGELGDRVILASLWDGPKERLAYSDDEWAQIVTALDA